MNTTLEPKVLRWARERARLSEGELAEKLSVTQAEVEAWETTGEISSEQVNLLAEKTFTAFGFLFLKSPPDQKLPISDFRRVKDASPAKAPSSELLDVLHAAQRRQKWYREHAISNDEQPSPFVRKSTLKTPVIETARDIRNTLKIGSALTANIERWEEALRFTIEAIEAGGILVIKAGYAGGYTHRKLSVEEFRGFALVDDYAPLIFVNGADASSAQMFTLVHEVAHIWLGESGVSNLEKTYSEAGDVERYCNEVAAEVLVPSDEMKISWRKSYSANEEVDRLSKKFKVSRIVIARRARDFGFITNTQYSAYYAFEVKKSVKSKGGNYYANEQYQNSRRFSTALIIDTRRGKTLYHDAMELLGIKKDQTFRKFAQSLQLEL